MEGETVYLVACTQAKMDTEGQEVPARELYMASPWFRHARTIAEAKGSRWFILSAWYGVLTPDTPVRTYNAFLGQYGVDMRRRWARAVWATLSAANVSGARVVVFAGSKYIEHLAPFLRNAGCQVELPLEGKQIGYQLQHLSQEALAVCFPPTETPANTWTDAQGNTCAK